MHPLIASAISNGAAADLYASLIPDPPMSSQWLKEIRTRWGNPNHPSLDCFPEVTIHSIDLPSLERLNVVNVSLLVPSNSTEDVVVYLHGGGWIAPMAGKHLGWAKALAFNSRRSVYAVHYRLAPENPFPAALFDCLGVLEEVFKRHSGNVCIVGDSAGANLAAACDQWRRRREERRTDKILLICGVLDLELEAHRSMIDLGIGHPYNGLELLAFQRALYAPDRSYWTNALASPAHGSLNDLPPTLVIVGEHDPLRDDGLDYARKARSEGADIKTHVGKGMPHGFVMQQHLVPEASAEAEKQILAFLAG